MELWLASSSPRRRELLTELGVPFTVCVPDVDESVDAGEGPHAYVERLARSKARAALDRISATQAALGMPTKPAFAVLGADTTVVCDRSILGKPQSRAEHERMLERLSGREHQVLTGVCIARCDSDTERSFVVATAVRFRPLSHAVITGYIASGDGADKAGGYAVQGMGSGFVHRIEGSYTNVVGLPAAETVEALLALGVLDSWPLQRGDGVLKPAHG